MGQDTTISLIVLAFVGMTVALLVIYCNCANYTRNNGANDTSGNSEIGTPLDDLSPAEEGRVSYHGDESYHNEGGG